MINILHRLLETCAPTTPTAKRLRKTIKQAAQIYETRFGEQWVALIFYPGVNDMPEPFDARMSRSLYVALCNGLMGEMASPDDCDHTHTRTQRLLAANGVTDDAPALAWLREHGGYCDCEVILNTVPPASEP